LDEALAVGDRDFRDRSLERISAIREQAHTVVMVSHTMGEIEQACSRTVWLEAGTVRMDGPTGDVLDVYAEATNG